MREDIPVILPAFKQSHVVFTDDKRELVLRKIPAQGLERVHRVRRTRQEKLIVRSDDVRNIPDRLAHGRQPLLLGRKRVRLFERIIRADHHPQLVQIGVLHNPFRQACMPEMNRVEAASVYADFFYHLFIYTFFHFPQ